MDRESMANIVINNGNATIVTNNDNAITTETRGEIMPDSMMFPKTVDEFMKEYKIVDTDEVYTNGAELVPIFRMKQWFEHVDYEPVVRCKDCKHYWKNNPTEVAVCLASPQTDAYCSEGERREDG